MSVPSFPLLSAETEKLQSLETIIQTRLTSFIEVGEALSAIRDERLYRATHATFEDYCRERWNLSRSYAHRLIDSVAVVEMLPAGDKSEITSERQARELAKVPPAKRTAVLRKARAKTGKVTAASIKAAATPSNGHAPDKLAPSVSLISPSNEAAKTETPVPSAASTDVPKVEAGASIVDLIADEQADALWEEHIARGVRGEKLLKADARAIFVAILIKHWPAPVPVAAPAKAVAVESSPFGDRKVIPPQPEWVTAYSASIGYPMNGQAWCDSYAAKGWLVGKAKMKDWQAAVRNWKSNGWGLGTITLAKRRADAPTDYSKF